MSEDRWSVYIVRCSDDSLYTGIARDPQARVRQHNSGRAAAKYTRGRRPVHLVYSENHASRTSAMRREFYIKSLPRRRKLALIDGGHE